MLHHFGLLFDLRVMSHVSLSILYIIGLEWFGPQFLLESASEVQWLFRSPGDVSEAWNQRASSQILGCHGLFANVCGSANRINKMADCVPLVCQHN